MKKSFKKAGAAVLSMAMLLSMGAISMPVFAANPTPGSVTVSIPGAFKQGEGDGDFADGNASATNPNKYQYLDLEGVSDARVSMYKVAELTPSGWQWQGVFDEVGTTPTSDVGFTSFDDLLAQVGGDTARKDNFTYSSSELQKLASYLERTIRNLKTASEEKDQNNQLTEAATAANAKLAALFKKTGTLTPSNPSVTLPGDNSTMNEIGWYLLMTETNESGVVVQPVLVSLKNGTQNPITASLKGTKIRIDKSIVDVSDKTDTVSDSKDTAVVAKDDTVTYEIKAQLPTYDSKVDPAKITTFVIDDTADAGIKVKEDTMKVYLSADGTLDLDSNGEPTATGKDYLLTKGANNDYTSTMKANNNGFTVNVTGQQMTGTTVTSTLDSIKTGENRTYQTMEGMYIIVRFDATVNEKTADGTDYKFKRTNNGYINASQVTLAQYNDTTITDDDIISAINRGIYTDDELESGAFTNSNLTGISLVDVLAKKQVEVNGSMVDVYLDNNNPPHEVTDVNQAASIEEGEVDKYHDGKRHAETIVTSGLRNRVRVLLARDKANNANGNKNTADMTYGNIYSTGGGEAHDTDTTRLFSVDVDFDKYTQKLTLAGKITKADLATSLEDMGWITLTGDVSNEGVIANADKAAVKAALTKLLLPTAADVTLEEAEKITPVPTIDTTTDADYAAINTANATWTEDQKKQGAQVLKNKKAAAADLMADAESTDVPAADVTTQLGLESGDSALATAISKAVAKENTNRDATGGYKSTTTDEAVQNAVFKLSKVNNPGASETLTTIGYAASDSNGDLRVLTLAGEEQYNNYVANNQATEDAGKIVLKVTEGTGQSATTTYWYYKEDNSSEYAWKMLTEGTYEIDEVAVPAGYKKYTGTTKPRFTIECATDDLSEDYTGVFSGESESDLFRDLETRKAATKETVVFHFNNTAGELENNIYNELADTLPATGGMGTVLFTAGGIAVVLMAGALFVMYMKKRNAEEEE